MQNEKKKMESSQVKKKITNNLLTNLPDYHDWVKVSNENAFIVK